MIYRADITNEYFERLNAIVSNKHCPKELSYRKLLMALHSTEFTYSIPKDKNRATDGLDLRCRFSLENSPNCNMEYVEYLCGPCSVLEMMVALALKCEEIMDDTSAGNRTGQWFWGMVVTMGLGAMTDSRFDRDYVTDVVNRFLNRDYQPDGQGGLFRVRHCDVDLRRVEIWWQMCWYLDSIS